MKTAVKAPEKVIIFLKGVAPSRRVCIIMRGSFEGRKEILDIFSAIEKDSLWSQEYIKEVGSRKWPNVQPFLANPFVKY